MSGFSADLFAGKRFAVLGLGRNGLPAAERLTACGASVTCWDDGEAGRATAVAAGLQVVRLEDASGLDALVLSPGIPHLGLGAHPLALDAMARGLPVLSDARLLFDAVRQSGSRARFVGITGTNGKSTTTVLVRHLLEAGGIEAVAGGNLGPASLALPLLGDAGVYVLEMSSYMLERVPGMRFDAAAMLNLSPDHLERHGGMAGYIAAKRQIFTGRTDRDLAVVGVDDPASARFAASLDFKPVTVSGSGRSADWMVSGGWLHHAGGRIADLSRVSLRGSHNGQNIAAAVAIAVHLGVAPWVIPAALDGFEGLEHRQKPVATVDGIVFVDDSKATNADAAGRALGCTERCIWIAGGLAKDGGIEPLAGRFGSVAEALLIGQDAEMFGRTLARHGVAFRIAGTLEAAVPMAFAAARKHGARTVLLSPAAASFDQFSDFEARGRRFAALVGALADGSGGRA